MSRLWDVLQDKFNYELSESLTHFQNWRTRFEFFLIQQMKEYGSDLGFFSRMFDIKFIRSLKQRKNVEVSPLIVNLLDLKTVYERKGKFCEEIQAIFEFLFTEYEVFEKTTHVLLQFDYIFFQEVIQKLLATANMESVLQNNALWQNTLYFLMKLIIEKDHHLLASFITPAVSTQIK